MEVVLGDEGAVLTLLQGGVERVVVFDCGRSTAKCFTISCTFPRLVSKNFTLFHFLLLLLLLLLNFHLPLLNFHLPLLLRPGGTRWWCG